MTAIVRRTTPRTTPGITPPDLARTGAVMINFALRRAMRDPPRALKPASLRALLARRSDRANALAARAHREQPVRVREAERPPRIMK
jgi:hypothetical protein